MKIYFKLLRVLLTLILLNAFSVFIQAQITVDNSSSVANFTTGGVRTNPVTFNHTITNNGEVLYVAVSNNITLVPIPTTGGCATQLPPTGTVPTVAGVPSISYTVGMTTQMTFERYTTNDAVPLNAIVSPNGCTSVEVFRLINPTVGTGTISVDVPVGGDYLVIGAVSFNAVNQSTPTAGALIASRGTSAAPSVSVPTSPNDFVLDALATEFVSQSSIVNPASIGQIEQYSGNFGGFNDVGAGSTKAAGAAGSTMTLWQLGNSGSWALGGVRIEQVSTGSPVSIGGQIRRNNNIPLPSSLVVLQNLNTGEQFYTQSDEKGRYLFEDLEVGNTYDVRVYNYKYDFAPNSQVLNLLDTREDIDFVGSIRRRNLTVGEFSKF